MVNPHCSIFRIITAIFRASEFLGFLRDSILVSLQRNPEDYLARQKAQEEEDKLEKIKHRPRFSDRRSETGNKDGTKRRSYAANVDEEAQRIAREYRAKRRSLNLDKKTDNSDRSLEHPKVPTRVRRKVSLEKKESEELKVKTDNFDKLNPESASSPRQNQSPEPTSPRSSTSPPRPSTKRKAAPPPPCSNKTASPPSSCPSKIPIPESPTKTQAPESPTKTQAPESPTKTQAPESPTKTPVAESTTKIPVPESQKQPSRPPRRKRKESDEKKPIIVDKEETKSEPVVYVNVNVKTDIVDTQETPETVDTKLNIKSESADDNVELIPKSNIDDFIFDTNLTGKINGETEESLLDTIIKDIPSLRSDQKLTEQSEETVIVANVKSALETRESENLNGYTEEVIIPSKRKDIECEITPVKVESKRGKFQPPESNRIEFREIVQEIVQEDNDSDIEVEIVVSSDKRNLKDSDLNDDDIVDGYFDVIKPAAFKRSDDLDNAFNKLITFEDSDKIKDNKDTISVKSDISDASSDPPPLPDSAPPLFALIEGLELTKVPSETEIAETVTETEEDSPRLAAEVLQILEKSELVPVKASIAMATAVGEHPVSASHEMPLPDEPLSPRSPEHPGSPIADLPASIFSMRVRSPPVRDEDVRSPTRDLHISRKLEVDVDGHRSDSDISDDEGTAKGHFSPGIYF